VAEWQAAASTATDHPFGGAGAGAYAQAARESQGSIPAIYPHSLPLEAWAELGPAGLVLVLGLYASVAALLWRLRRDPRLWPVGPAMVAFLVANLVDWPWHLAGAGAVWALALGACLALRSPRCAD
jgi:O-antigen ligase